MENQGSWTYYLGEDFRETARAIAAVIHHMQLRSVNLLGDLTSDSLHLSHLLQQNIPEISWNANIYSQTQAADYMMGNVIRPYGNRVTIFTSSAATTKDALKAQHKMHIGGEGYANLLTEESALYEIDRDDTEPNLAHGNLLVTRQLFAHLSSPAAYYRALYELIEPYLLSDAADLPLLITSRFPTNRLQSHYLLLNMQNGTREVVGRIVNSTCEVTAPIVYLGGVWTPPSSLKATLPVSGNFGGEVIDGYRYTVDSKIVGALIAIDEVNDSPDMLPNFLLSCWNFTGGIGPITASVYNSTILPYAGNLGTATFAGITSVNTVTMISYMRAHNITVPVIGSVTTSKTLSSRSAYPYFIRTCVSDEHVNVATVQMIKRLGWSQIALIVVDRPSDLSLRTSFLRLLTDSNITVVTPPEYQVIASVDTLEAARENYTASLQYLIDSRCRIVLLLSIDFNVNVFLMLYELGMRKGDLVIVTRDIYVEDTLEQVTEEQQLQLAEVMYGSLQVFTGTYTGAIGQVVSRKVQQRMNSAVSDYACYYYDSAYTVVHALQWMLQHGKDFYNATAMMHALRGVRFVGCTGFVYFDPRSNDREAMRFIVISTGYNQSTGLFSQQIGTFDPSGVTLFHLNADFTWGDGTARIPSNMRESTLGCPFEDRLVRQFRPGLWLFLGISLSVCCISCLTSYLVYFKFHFPFDILRERREIALGDLLVILQVPIELFQLLALAPKTEFLGERIDVLLSLGIGDISAAVSLQDGGFQPLWIVLECVLAVWGLLVVLDTKCVSQDSLSYSLLSSVGYLISHWLFIPIIFTLFSIFLCTESAPSFSSTASFPDSFLEDDCYVSCWTPSHLTEVCVSVVTAVVFVPVCAYYRVRWQNWFAPLNLKSTAKFLYVKSLVWLLLTSVAQGLDGEFQVVHSSLHLVILGTYTVMCWKWGDYNYSHLRIGHFTALLVVFWYSLNLLVSQFLSFSFPLFQVLTAVGWVLVLICSFLYVLLRVPGLLYRSKGINTFHLFKFAFKPTTREIARNLQLELEKYHKACVFRADNVLLQVQSPVTGATGPDMVILEITT